MVGPCEVMQALLALRSNFRFDVDTMPSRPITPDRPIFDQLPPTRVYNIVAFSSAPTIS